MLLRDVFVFCLFLGMITVCNAKIGMIFEYHRYNCIHWYNCIKDPFYRFLYVSNDEYEDEW